MRCAWCKRPALAWSVGTEDSPDCGRSRCVAATDEVWRARMELRERLSGGRPASIAAHNAAELAARQAELRSEPIDWTRPVEGWVLFDAVTP